MFAPEYATLLLQLFQDGEIIAYPTEAVFGLGCDPDNQTAVMRLLALKKRNIDKGLILVASNYQQLQPYIEESSIPPNRMNDILASWPGPNTWLLPASANVGQWLTGGSDVVAVRVSQHPVICMLADLFQKPLVSTSANVSGQPAALSIEQVMQQFANQVHPIDGPLGGASKPSRIRHGLSGAIIRES
ncbi:MAG: L-threonylcarbamoyladenylate synthase type 1 TsaC [Paraglaciecola sp.]|nr:L-threonylcarbamoyladenylate synthase type 1 TsaC [Paraglaciecola sp.]NCT49804.1 L-threonylcarbamoyladenylate synthase type 1 TsaC [Paraglaciecola sp.]